MKRAKKVIREIPAIKTADPDTGEIITTPARVALVDEMVEDANEYKPFWKTPWNHDTDNEATASGTLNVEPSKTQTHQADDTNINTIMRRYGITGPEQLAPPPPSYAEFPEDWDMHTVIEIQRRAHDAFMQLPARIRAEFDNDLARYVGTVNELQKRGDVESLKAMGLDVELIGAPKTPQAPPPEAPKTEPPK